MRKRDKKEKKHHVPPGHPEHPAERHSPPAIQSPPEEHPVMPEASGLLEPKPSSVPEKQEHFIKRWWISIKGMFV